MRDLGAALTALALLVAVAGCADDAQPSTLPDVTPTDVSTAPVTEPPETAMANPSADSTEALNAEVEDFIRAYEEARDESWVSDDALAQRREMFADDCDACLVGYDMVTEARSQGLTFQGKPSELLDVDVLEANNEHAAVMVMVDVAAAKLTDDSGEVLETFPASPDLQIIYQLYRPQGGEWVVIRSETL